LYYISFLKENHWEQQSIVCKQMILEAYPRFCELMESEPICEVSSEFLGQMCSIPIRPINPAQLQIDLFHQHHIEIPIVEFEKDCYLRISIQAYNSQDDVNYLHEVFKKMKSTHFKQKER
jgi:isopenicillin-N epimerase